MIIHVYLLDNYIIDRMSVIDLETGPSTTVSSIHLIPCCIDYNGPANVNKYFHSSCKEKSDNKGACFCG